MWIRQQKDDGYEVNLASGGNSENAGVLWEFTRSDAGVAVEAGFVRGVTDTDRSALKLTRSDGTAVYIYVDTGTTVVCSTTAP